MQRFQDQVAIVTGAARGIGRGIAQRLATEGARVLVFDIDQQQGETAVGEMTKDGLQADLVVGDVSEEKDVDRAVKQAIQAWGRVDVMVNNAAITGKSAYVWDLPVEELDLVYRVNLRGVYLFCQKVAVPMRNQNYGRIVNIASLSAKEGFPKMAAYSAVKAGVVALTKALGKELAETNIRINCITPAVVWTEMTAKLPIETLQPNIDKIPIKRTVEIREIASLVTWLASEECSASTGAVFDISGGRATY